jgi:hypothetical protein
MKGSMKYYQSDKDFARHDDVARIIDKEPMPDCIQAGLAEAFLGMGCGSVAQRFGIKNIFGIDNNKCPKRFQQRNHWGCWQTLSPIRAVKSQVGRRRLSGKPTQMC